MVKITGKRLTALLLTIAIIITFMPVVGNLTDETVGTQTVYAAGEKAYARYDSSDSSLTFFKSNDSYTNGQTNGSLTYYTNFVGDYLNANELPWHEIRKNVKTVRFEDVIRPAGTHYWFYNFENLKTIENLQYLDTSDVTWMSYMFANCLALESLDVSKLNTSKVEYMDNMFRWCKSLNELDLSHFDTSNVLNMSYMFYGLEKIKNLDLSSFKTDKVTNMAYMFCQSSILGTIDLSSFNVSNVSNMQGMFSNCPRLTTVYVNPSIWDASGVSNSSNMFYDTRLPGYDPSKVDAKMAVIKEEGGYLTASVPTKVSIIKAVVTGIKDKRYTGSAVTQLPVVTINGKELRSGTDYTVSYRNNIGVGIADIIITGKGSYNGVITKSFRITRAANPLTVKAKTADIKYAKLLKKNQTLAVNKVIKFKKNGQGRMKYKLLSVKSGKKNFKKYFKVSSRTGKLTVKKGLKKGIYRIKVKVRAEGNANYKASAWKTVTYKINIK